MKTLLRIDASARINGSNTRVLADYFQTKWLSHNPEDKVIHRCLASNPIPHITNETIKAFQHADELSSNRTLSDTLIDELKRADHLLIGSPLYNLTLPSTLKAYFDHVVRAGLTFEVRQGNYRGLLTGKTATLITARGSKSSPTDDFQTTYLRKILAFIGIDAVDVVALDGLTLDQQTKEKAISCAQQQIDDLLNRTVSPVWQGEFSEYDKQQINFLRAGQADAIVKGDAQAYAELCADNIQLLIPSQDVITGRNALLEAEQKLFSRTKFASFQKIPLHIERSGNLAVEVGRQEVTMHKHHDTDGIFSTCQKYTHVFRLTPQGWRFAMLMSNPNE
ncbi:fmn-dependent nadh-azoreductase [Leptolyngbya sp. Heron Island J]|uniref:NAD(P)H-dependent oxidoreductase n=1 Tax=Leptolyngbya sp. Heron Island J TaxID=1385935 RepID=UPI0003B9CDA9|nr:NAD(P)H-dependent oxidoreductase [Leptolyngbya sp. Heron Island J]ESA35310.1 fmn-dependent nadh-azoreductase [Leptolyngbya sp. Heron Island J]